MGEGQEHACGDTEARVRHAPGGFGGWRGRPGQFTWKLSLEGDGEPLDTWKQGVQFAQRGCEMDGVDLAAMVCMYEQGSSVSWKGA